MRLRPRTIRQRTSRVIAAFLLLWWCGGAGCLANCAAGFAAFSETEQTSQMSAASHACCHAKPVASSSESESPQHCAKNAAENSLSPLPSGMSCCSVNAMTVDLPGASTTTNAKRLLAHGTVTPLLVQLPAVTSNYTPQFELPPEARPPVYLRCCVFLI